MATVKETIEVNVPVSTAARRAARRTAALWTFEPMGGSGTRVNVDMTYETEGIVEKLGSAVGADDRRVKGDLERFKELIESRGTESGAWRGEVE